jgi:hypothetical protein
LLAAVEGRGVAGVVDGGGGAVAHDAHVAGGGRVVRIEAGGGAVVGRDPVAGEQRAGSAADAEPGVARGRAAGAGIGRQRAFDLEQDAGTAAQIFLPRKPSTERLLLRRATGVLSFCRRSRPTLRRP